MRPVTLVQAGQGSTNWLPIDYTPGWFGVGLGLSFSENSNLTAEVQHTFNGMAVGDSSRTVSLSQSTTTVTITDTGPDGLGHRALTGDSVVLIESYGTGQIDGEYTITVTGLTTYTITVTPSQTKTGLAKAETQRVFTHSTLVALTARQDGYYAYNIRATRLTVTAGTTGYAYLDVVQGLGR